MLRLIACILTLAVCFTAQAQLKNPFGLDITPKVNPIDAPVQRGYIVPSADAIPGGVNITVDIYHQITNFPVSLWLQVVVNDGRGVTSLMDLKQLSNAVADNPTFRSRRQFSFTYQELNALLHGLSPQLAKLQIGPGTALFVYAKWANGHQWGGPMRGGVIFMPDDPSAANAVAAAAPSAAANAGGVTSRPSELDIAFTIPQTLANLFNDPATNNGLKVGGQIRSRVEGEGKFQVPLADYDKLRVELFRLVKNPSAATQVLGSEWTLTLVDRYMQKDAAGNMILDAAGLPTPDPMVDTYYDNATYEAAKKDVAIRYRWTEANKTGAWNFKPGIGVVTSEGVVYRIEDGVDATDDKPATIKKFVDSTHPLNPFQMLRDIAPGSAPSDFLNPSVKISDVRYKFKLQHKNGLLIEMSLDNVTASDLRALNGNAKTKHFVQLEMDIEHMATQALAASGAYNSIMHQGNMPLDARFLGSLNGNEFIDGRPVLHDESDLAPSSPLFAKHKGEFDLAAGAIKTLRDHLLGANWLPGAQKYALAADELGLVNGGAQAPSVATLKQKSCSALLQGGAAIQIAN